MKLLTAGMRAFVIGSAILSTFQLIAQNPTGSPVALHGQLKTKGSHIVGNADTAVSFAGNSLFFSQWGGEFYNASVIKWLKDDWHCSIVRAAMGVEDTDGYLTNPDSEKQKVMTVVDACIAQGMYVIIDWHSQHAQDYPSQAIGFFKEMATKYGAYPNVIYEVYNEPLDTDSWSQTIKPYATNVINEIRKIDPDNLILVGTRSWDQEVVEAGNDPINLPNIAYTLHFYVGTHGIDLLNKAQQALNNGVPLFVSEWGLWGSDADLDMWVTFMKNNKLSWCNWSIITKDEPSSALKAGASSTGTWKSTDLTSIGTKVRDYMRNWPWNTVPLPCTVKTSPYLAMSLPGIVEAENYDTGCADSSYHDADAANQGGKYRTDGVDIETCTDAGGGFSVGYIEKGEWLTYTLSIKTNANYNVKARVASLNGGGSFRLQLDGANIGNEVTVPTTGGWQNWTDVSLGEINLSEKAKTKLTVLFTNSGFNLNRLSFTSVVTGLEEEALAASNVKLYPSGNAYILEAAQNIRQFSVYNMAGTLVLQENDVNTRIVHFGEPFQAGMYIVLIHLEDGTARTCKFQK